MERNALSSEQSDSNQNYRIAKPYRDDMTVLSHQSTMLSLPQTEAVKESGLERIRAQQAQKLLLIKGTLLSQLNQNKIMAEGSQERGVDRWSNKGSQSFVLSLTNCQSWNPWIEGAGRIRGTTARPVVICHGL